MFEALKVQIGVQSDLVNVLISLLNTIEDGVDGVFDDEDLEEIKSKLESNEAKLKYLKLALFNKEELYEKQVVGLENNILMRSKLLKKVDGLSNFPDLFGFFTAKQLHLEDEVSQIKLELETQT
jgi:hypothetical protein